MTPDHNFEDAYAAPLAELLRPRTLDEFVGQTHLVDMNHGQISGFIQLGYLPSMVLAGPPGVGKTTLASILAASANYIFIELSATDSTVSELKELLKSIREENAKRLRHVGNSKDGRLRVAVFIDEIHRFLKIQQDFLLPFIESGDFVFIGATTVEPHKRIRRAILSRCQLFCLTALGEQDSLQILRRAILNENIRRKRSRALCFLDYSDVSVMDIAKYANGDMRSGINCVELLSSKFTGSEYRIEVVGQFSRLSEDIVRNTIETLYKSRLGIKDVSNLGLVELLLLCISGELLDLPSEGVDLTSKTKPGATIADSEKQLFAKIKLSPLVLSLFEVERSEPIPVAIDSDFKLPDRERQWVEAMNYSDDSDEEIGAIPGSLDSTSLQSVDFESSFNDYRLFSAIYTMSRLLEKGESVLLILKYLILFTCLYSKGNGDELHSVVGSMKAVGKAAVNPSRVLSDCIEFLCFMPKSREELLVKRIEQIKKFLASNAASDILKEGVHNPFLFEIVYDRDLESQILAPVTSSQSAGPSTAQNEFKVELMSSMSLDDLREFEFGLDSSFLTAS